MFESKIKFFIVLAAMLVFLGKPDMVSAETWQLEQGSEWKTLSSKDQYLTKVARIKQLVNEGKEGQVSDELNKLKKDFPEISGPDLDVFIKAEIFFSKGKFSKAIRNYDELLDKHPNSKLYEAALDREFAIATAFLAGRKRPILKIFKIKGYDSGINIMEKISDRAGEGLMAMDAALAIVKSYEKRGKFNDAYHKWSEISSRWPTGKMGKDALLGMARCKHAAYKGPKYDASELTSAKSYYENFELRYSKDAVEINADGKLNQINEQMAYKQFSIGQYYQKTDSKQAANFYYQMVIDNWPESTAAKMAKQKMNNAN